MGALTSPAVLSEPIMEALAVTAAPKFLATVSGEGAPNIVPVLSLEAAGEGTIIFAELMIWKTRRNLEANPRVCVALMTPGLQGWVIRGDFVEFQQTGPHYDHLMALEAFRYNAYAGIRSAGVIRVREVVRAFDMSQTEVLLGAVRARWLARRLGETGRPGTAVPSQVREKFARLKGAKFMAYVDADGYPDIVPVLSLRPADERTLVFVDGTAEPALSLLEPGAQVAASVLTFEPLAYQVKGEFLGVRRSLGRPAGVLAINEVYSACPPLPGKRIV
jgi:predicted pyridoxine 5'-phosphate oxidase superfamily flavin-nucleotide-binding protein